MLSFLLQLQMARHSLDHDERQLRHLQETYNLNVKVLDIKDEKLSNKDIKQLARKHINDLFPLHTRVNVNQIKLSNTADVQDSSGTNAIANVSVPIPVVASS